MSVPKKTKADAALVKELCGACGLCCNGAIFADVQLRPGDDQARLKSLGLEMKNPSAARGRAKFLQPCAAHDGCRCRIYSERPEYCRAFECALLQNVYSGAIKKAKALGLIREAKEKLAAINGFLSQLGNGRETLSHRIRFKQVERQMKQGIEQAKIPIFADLTLAVHELNVLLAASFYPGQTRIRKA